MLAVLLCECVLYSTNILCITVATWRFSFYLRVILSKIRLDLMAVLKPTEIDLTGELETMVNEKQSFLASEKESGTNAGGLSG